MPISLTEKRQYARFPLKMPLHCKIRGEAKDTYTTTENLSPGGIGFIYESFIPTDAYLMLEFNILQRSLTSIGRIAWTSGMAHTHMYRCGVEFVEIDQQTKNFLRDFCTLKVYV